MTVQETDIVWTDYSANHWVGCARISEGCQHCWAAGMADRFDRTPKPWTVEHVDENLRVYDEDFADQLNRADPGWVFTPSSSDPYLPAVPGHARMEWLEGLRENPQHSFQVLTKWGPEKWEIIPGSLPGNAMLGVSVGTSDRTYRIDWLREQPVETRFVSFEPLVEPIGEVDLSGIDWIIVGGESHRNADQRREMDPEWARDLYHQAREQDVAYLFKQHSGAYAEKDTTLKVDGVYREIHEFPKTPKGLPDAPRAFLSDEEVVA